MNIRQRLASIFYSHSAGFLAAGLIWGSASAICCPCPTCIAGSATCLAKGAFEAATRSK